MKEMHDFGRLGRGAAREENKAREQADGGKGKYEEAKLGFVGAGEGAEFGKDLPAHSALQANKRKSIDSNSPT